MSAIDQTHERIDASLDGLWTELREMRREFHEELRGVRRDLADLRSDFAAMQGRLVQIGFGLVGTLLASLVALILALAK